MKTKEVLKPFIDELKEFMKYNGEKTVDPLDPDDIGKFYVMICEDGSYYQVDMDNSYWIEEDDGTLVFRVNDETGCDKMYEERIAEIRKIINNFANQGQYSANNPYVKALYRELRELEGRQQVEDDDDFTPQFIGGSDVPINGEYE